VEVADADFIRIANAQLRYYMHLPDPDALSDEDWAAAYQELLWVREKEAKGNKRLR
jgi:hypothetical protein